MKYKRAKLNLNVKRKFQLWLLKRVMGTVLICSVVSGAILYFYASKELADSFFDVHIEIRRVSDLLLPVVLGGSGVSIISGLLLTIFLPQKIAGPIYRIEEDLKQIQQGDLRKVVKLRASDPLDDLVKAINSTVAALTARIDACEDRLKKIKG